MTEAQKRLVELDKKKDEIKKFHDDLSAAVEAVIVESGVGSYFQDDDGTVYKTVVPDGKFVYFEKHSYVRTRRSTEKQGSLSLKEAEEHGFTIKK